MSADHERIVHLEKKQLRRILGAKELFAIGYGDVGSSIYYALGLTAMYALGATPLALLIAGVVFICTALTYAEMSTTFPEAGGSATFARHAFNDFISFIAGWGLLLDYIVTTAISAFAIPPYLAHVFPFANSTFVHISGTIAIIAFLYTINVIGVKESGRLSWLLALLTILSQGLVILIAAVTLMNLPFIIDHLRIGVPGVDWSPDWWGFLKGTSMAMVAYTGVEAIAQLSAETKKPSVNIPKAIKWTFGFLVTLYFFLSVVGLSVTTPQELGTTYINDPVAGIIVHFPFGGQILAPWFGLIAAAILLIASNAGLIGCSRLTFSMGEHYQLPRFFHQLHARFRTPHISLAVFSILACLLVLASRGEMLFLADLYNFGAQIAFFFAHISLITLRLKQPGLARPYKAPFNIFIDKKRSIPLTAILGAFATFAVWLIVIITKPEGRYLGFSWLIIGSLLFYLYRKKEQISLTGLSIEKVRIPQYHPIHLKNILVAGDTTGIQMACQLAKNAKASLTYVFILEVPLALSIDAAMPRGEKLAKLKLDQAEAIGREYHMPIHLKFIRSRTEEVALSQLTHTGAYDLLITAKDGSCRILFCKT